MIIRIDKFTSVGDPSGSANGYSAWLVTDVGDVCIVPANDSFLYVEAIARRVKELLLYKTPENIRIDYPEDMGIEKERGTFSVADDGQAPGVVGIDNTVNYTPSAHTTARIRSRNKLPFESSGTLAGIKLQARNVAERAALSDYQDFVEQMKKIVAQLEDDVTTRQQEAEATPPSLADLIAERLVSREDSVTRKYVPASAFVEQNIMPLIREYIGQ